MGVEGCRSVYVGVGNPDPQLQLISPKVTFAYRGKRRAATAIGKVLGLCALCHHNPPPPNFYFPISFRLSPRIQSESNQHCLTNNLFATSPPEKRNPNTKTSKPARELFRWEGNPIFCSNCTYMLPL